MPLATGKPLILCIALLLAPALSAQSPPVEQEVAAARAAVTRAEARKPVGQALQDLQKAQAELAQAEQFLAKRKSRDAARTAQRAEALADLSAAEMRRVEARRAVDDKTARNSNLRRELLVVPGAQR